jgi:hypothetical protein
MILGCLAEQVVYPIASMESFIINIRGHVQLETQTWACSVLKQIVINEIIINTRNDWMEINVFAFAYCEINDVEDRRSVSLDARILEAWERTAVDEPVVV